MEVFSMKENPTQQQLPPGTQVVSEREIIGTNGKTLHPRGAVGMVVGESVTGSYRVRFHDGYEVALDREEIGILGHVIDERSGSSISCQTGILNEYIIYRCIVGSRAYGLEGEASDTDVRGIFLPPADLHWSLYGVPEQIENNEEQTCFWEIGKFIVLALKANPTILECLYSPLVELATPAAHDLLAHRDIFLSRLVYQTYNGYVLSQFRKLERYLELHGAIRWKHAMHLIRLLLCGISILRDGTLRLRVDEHRDMLLAIRHGEIPWKEIDARRHELHREFDAAFAATRLPEFPDYDRANRLLVEARRSMV